MKTTLVALQICSGLVLLYFVGYFLGGRGFPPHYRLEPIWRIWAPIREFEVSRRFTQTPEKFNGVWISKGLDDLTVELHPEQEGKIASKAHSELNYSGFWSIPEIPLRKGTYQVSMRTTDQTTLDLVHFDDRLIAYLRNSYDFSGTPILRLEFTRRNETETPMR